MTCAKKGGLAVVCSDTLLFTRLLPPAGQAIAEDKNRLSRLGEHVVPTAGGDAFAPVLLAQRAEAAAPTTTAKASRAATVRSIDPRQATAPPSRASSRAESATTHAL